MQIGVQLCGSRRAAASVKERDFVDNRLALYSLW